MMNIGVCVSLPKTPIASSFENITKMGFHHCQLMSWDRSLRTPEKAEEIKAACLAQDVTVTALWCGWSGPAAWNFYEGQETLGLVPPAYRFERMQDLMNGADFAKELGVTDIVSHMGFIPENPHDPLYPGVVAAVRAVAAHLQQNGQYLLFETGQETPVTLLRLFEDVAMPNLGVNLDPANLILYGKGNPVDALDVFGKYVRGVHGKDGNYPTNGRELGAETPMGQGKVDFPALLKKLAALGYDGSITIEREIEGDQQAADILTARELLLSIINKL
ncbi:MAG: sugar phosphate isomerase/epimerase family protein [Acutalibacteraceae bacterium]